MHAPVTAYLRRHWREHSGWLVSVCVHVALLLLFACWLLPRPTGSATVSIDSRFSDTQQAEPFDTPIDIAAPAPGEELSDTSGQIDDSALSEPPSLTMDDTTRRLGPSALMPGDGVLGSAMGSDGTGGGSGFFGVSAAGRKFVYVVDASGSMEGRRFRRARYELTNSIRKLRSHQQFYVIFYNYDAHPMPMPELISASRSNLEKVREWIRQMRPVGPTYPGNALQIALDLKPDAIYFLSDGIFDADVVEAVHKANGAKIAIHTICFEDRVGEPVLQVLAAQNGGKYRFVR
jgi:hypothetical protein